MSPSQEPTPGRAEPSRAEQISHFLSRDQNQFQHLHSGNTCSNVSSAFVFTTRAALAKNFHFTRPIVTHFTGDSVVSDI